MKVERDIQLDATRGLGMLFVIYGHVLELAFLENGVASEGSAFAVYCIIYAFHMPLFFLIAGVADRLAGRGTLRAASTAALKLVLTAFVFSSIAFLSQALIGGRTAGGVLIDLFGGTAFGLAPLWFLPALALVRVLYAAAATLPNRTGFWSLLAGGLAISWICVNLDFRFWQLHTLFGALPFYVIGRVSKAAARKTSVPAAACGLATLLLLAPGNFVHLASNQYGDLPISLACALGGCCFAFFLVSRLRGTFLAAIAHLGHRSFDLFIVSGIVLTALPMMRHLDSALGLIALASIGIPLQIALALLLHRPITALRRLADRIVDVIVPCRPAEPLAA